jgi:NAD kinase
VKGETPFVHHHRKFLALNWDTEPTSVSLLVQDRYLDRTDQIQELTQFLKDLGLRVELNEYNSADFIVLLGSDGWHPHVSSLFQDRETPPILSLAPERKGFVSFIEFCEYAIVIPQVIRGNCFLLPRARLFIEYHSLEGVERYSVFNDLCVNRDALSQALCINCSSSGFGFSQLECDGIIIATPTGSTAYNKAAGGALVHPLLAVFMLTPISAMSLSARPIIFPQSADLTISLGVPKRKEHVQKAVITFDGVGHKEFQIGEKLVISISRYCFHSIVMNHSIGEWFVRLAGLLSWNERRHQKPLPPAGPKPGRPE